jgi:predicted N-formylglutamate amidohydrolase
MTNFEHGAVPLLGSHDPLPVRFTPGADRRWLVTCDHAGNAVPRKLGDLGVTGADRLDHIGWDIGAAAVARRIAARLSAPLIEGAYSRLVIDCNRYPSSPEAIPVRSNGRLIPGNAALPAVERQRRIGEIFASYHRLIAAKLDEALAEQTVPILLAIHTCTASLDGIARPWEIGIGWTRDRRVARPLVEALSSSQTIRVGDNEPYRIDLGLDFSVPEHAMARGLAHVQVEFRNDLLANDSAASHWADQFVTALQAIREPGEWREIVAHLGPEDRAAGVGLGINYVLAGSR